jgi:copper transport protein
MPVHSLATLRRRLGVILSIGASLLLLLAAPASAHTGFESSSPAAGETIDRPVTEISLTFSGEATPAGDGFVILDPEGIVRVPDEITSPDNLTWTLGFDEPLVEGTVAVRWRVAAPDAHPIEGSFSFNVDAAVPITGNSAESLAASEELVSPVDLVDFLDTTNASPTGVARVGDVGRAISLLGVVMAIGGITFAALTLRGNRSDIKAVLYWVRRAGLFTMLGVLVEGAAQVAKLAAGWSGLWSLSALVDGLGSSFGVALLLRFIGGALIGSGARLNIHSAEVAADPVVAVKQLVSVGAGRSTPGAVAGPNKSTGEPFLHAGDEAWHIGGNSAAFIGFMLIVGSFLFDGHTVSEGPRWIHGVANAIHVTTAATWAGGVTMLALVIARRHRRGADTRALQLAVRFSVVATIGLIAAAAAGMALTVVILDSVSEIWSTPWGRLLIAKVLLVCVVAAGGGYNHRIVIPALERRPDDEAVAHRFRTIVTFEAVGLVIVTVLTAILISTSSA